MSKRLKILLAAYEGNGGLVQRFMDYNGWIPEVHWLNCEVDESIKFDVEFRSTVLGSWRRPIALRGIETNNGWIRIKKDNTIPTGGELYKIGNLTNERWIEFGGSFSAKDVEIFYLKGEISHYRPITENLKPFY